MEEHPPPYQASQPGDPTAAAAGPVFPSAPLPLWAAASAATPAATHAAAAAAAPAYATIPTSIMLPSSDSWPCQRPTPHPWRPFFPRSLPLLPQRRRAGRRPAENAPPQQQQRPSRWRRRCQPPACHRRSCPRHPPTGHGTPHRARSVSAGKPLWPEPPVALTPRGERQATVMLVPRGCWVPDASRSHCTLCPTQFTFFHRRHHCRYGSPPLPCRGFTPALLMALCVCVWGG